MRPAEINYSHRQGTPHYDIATGEVLTSKRELKEYVGRNGQGQAYNVIPLAPLLLDMPRSFFDNLRPDYNEVEWDKQRCVQYGKWLYNVILPYVAEDGKRVALSREILQRASKLGLGPPERYIVREFGGFSNLYTSIGANKVQNNRRPEFTQRQMADHIEKNIGEQKPTHEVLREIFTLPPFNYRHIKLERALGGKAAPILVLAGYCPYQAVTTWAPDDFIAWGVKFMEANDGTPPGAYALEHLSNKMRGPSPYFIGKFFDSIPTYEKQVIMEYGRVQNENAAKQATNLAQIDDGLAAGRIPAALFTKQAHGLQKGRPLDQDKVTADLQQALHVGQSPAAVLLQHFDADTLISRYAKYQVLTDVFPSISLERKVGICTFREQAGDFSAKALFKLEIEPDGAHATDTIWRLEYAATIRDVVDYLWPLNKHLNLLKLGTEFTEFANQQRQESANRRKRLKEGLPAGMGQQIALIA